MKVRRKIIKIDEELCDGCGQCVPACAEGAIQIVEGKARLVSEKYCDGLGACLGECPKGAISIEEREAEAFDEEEVTAYPPSLLSHWPVKLRLVPPNAPYFKNSELVIAADCCPFACGSFHQDFLQGRAVVTGCPKFDDLQFYQQKLTEILRHSGIRKIIVAVMEVPCCSGWMSVAQKAVSDSGKEIPIEEEVIGVKGEVSRN
ncbi:MAG: 4Fe-4S ferredoxin [Deltaproteobacteria bacterium]|nr:MAG: 4Fe-4S ferredoxin [Deltaproteobacteria bacterium]